MESTKCLVPEIGIHLLVYIPATWSQRVQRTRTGKVYIHLEGLGKFRFISFLMGLGHGKYKLQCAVSRYTFEGTESSKYKSQRAVCRSTFKGT